jgi:glycosyltransferase involved in cell wall biosynthesis
LIIDSARALPNLTFVLVGPDALSSDTRARLVAEPNILILGSRPYEAVPGYLQHADVIVVPHVLNRFTESLDPIKAYECVAASRPTVATPVAGFRGLNGRVAVASGDQFMEAVRLAVSGRNVEPRRDPTPKLATWEDRALAFESIVLAAASRART